MLATAREHRTCVRFTFGSISSQSDRSELFVAVSSSDWSVWNISRACSPDAAGYLSSETRACSCSDPSHPCFCRRTRLHPRGPGGGGCFPCLVGRDLAVDQSAVALDGVARELYLVQPRGQVLLLPIGALRVPLRTPAARPRPFQGTAVAPWTETPKTSRQRQLAVLGKLGCGRGFSGPTGHRHGSGAGGGAHRQPRGVSAIVIVGERRRPNAPSVRGSPSE